MPGLPNGFETVPTQSVSKKCVWKLQGQRTSSLLYIPF